MFKYFPSAKAVGFEGSPKLVRAPTIFRPRPGLRSASAVDLKLISSVTDPLGDLPVHDIVDAWYGDFDNTMLPGRTVRRIRPYAFAPYALARFDIYSLIDEGQQRPLTMAERLRLRRRLRRY